MSVRARLLLVIVTALGVSVACNIAAAEPTLLGRAVAAWPPLALMLVVEVLSRAPLPAGRLRWVAVGGAGIVAVTAAVASFHHMHSVALAAGESDLVAWLFPLTVDGLAVVASVALMGQHQTDPDPVLEQEPVPVFEQEPVPVFEQEPVPVFEQEPVVVLEQEPVPVLEQEPVGVVFPPVLNGIGSTK